MAPADGIWYQRPSAKWYGGCFVIIIGNASRAAMFIRVKRKKTTYFLHCDPSETVLEIKQKLQALSDNPVDCQRLILLSSQLVLEDSKTLADQKVENDAIVALCLKTSDHRVHRISTGLRPPPDPRLCEKSELTTPKQPQEAEGEVQLGKDGQALTSQAAEPVLLERVMSTLLRTPYKPPPLTPVDIAKTEAAEKEAAKLAAAKKSAKDDRKMQKGLKGKKEDGKKGAGKKETAKTGTKVGAANKKGKKGKKGKRGDKEERDGKAEVEQIFPPPDTGVWEDICIDRLTDYATLIDSD